ncbi:MAG: hypothetical protein PHG67_11985 [Bacteroidales bacterium]|nr:hypothetical protein [Bacteroidales bacterium]
MSIDKLYCIFRADELRTDRRAADNAGFASGAVIPFRSSRDKLCKPGALCFYSSVVQVDPARAGLQNPPERKARKRYRVF